jgi:fatty-acyl-CoA synthase
MLTQIPAAAAALVRAGVLRPLVPSPALVKLGLSMPFTTPSLSSAVALQAATQPGRLAIVDGRGGQTWRQTDARVSALAHVMLARAAERPGDPATAAFLVRNSRECVEAYAAGARSGLAPVPVNTWSSPGDLAHVAETQDPAVVVVDPEFADAAAEAFGADRLLVTGDDYEAALAAAPRGMPSGPGTARIVTHTSGTTGRPKGAERDLSADSISALTGFLDKVPLHRTDEFCIASPLFHALGQGMLGVALVVGCTLVLPPRFDPEDLLATIAAREVRAVAMVPIMLRRLLEAEGPATPSWEIGVLSGSPLPSALRERAEERFGRIFYDLYGSTEVGWATIATPRDQVERPGTVGSSAPGIEVLAVDDDGQPLPAGEQGRIVVRTGMAFQGYTDADATEDILEDGAVDTGDLGHVDDDGYLYLAGRADDMIVSGGENIYPSEVEGVLDEHPDIIEAAVLGVDDEEYGEVLHAYVVVREGSGLDAEGITAHAREHLARYKVPKEVHLREELPRNAAGKVVKGEL